MRAKIFLLLMFIVWIPHQIYRASAQPSEYGAGLFQFENEVLNYSGTWDAESEGGITREFTDSGSVEFDVIGQTLVIQRRMCPDCGLMTVDVGGAAFSYDNSATDTADYPLLIALDNTPLTITITAVGDLWLNYFMVLDPAVDALPLMPEPDALVVWAVRPEYQYHNRSGQIVALAHSVSSGELVTGVLFYGSMLMILFLLVAGEGRA